MLALGSAAAFGFNITFARVAALEGVQGPTLVAWRVVILLVIAGVAALVLRSGLGVARGERRAFAVLALASAGVSLCYICSVAFIPITVAAVIFYTFPVLIVLASPFVEGRRLDRTLVGIVLVAFLGVVLVVGPAFGGLDPRGLLLAAGASLSAVVQFFAGSRCLRTGSLSKVVWIQMAVVPIVFATALATGGPQSPATLLLAPWAVFFHIAGYLVGFILQMLALVRISAVVAGLAFCLEPVVAAVTSAVVLEERLLAIQYAGGACVIGAIAANVLAERRRVRRVIEAGQPA